MLVNGVEMVSKNFSQRELACSCCGKCDMHPDMVDILQSIRDYHDKPLFISSAYRCVNHPVEVMKDKPGEHTYGMAVDIICHGGVALDIIKIAQTLSIIRIGMNQKGRASSRFIHLGIANYHSLDFPSNALWTY